MRLKLSQNKTMLILILFYIGFIQTSQSKTCTQLCNIGYFNSSILTKCYTALDQHFIGTEIGNLSNCIYECGNWTNNYNTQISFKVQKYIHNSACNIDIYYPCHNYCQTCNISWYYTGCTTCKPGLLQSIIQVSQHPQLIACFPTCLQRQNYYQVQNSHIVGQYLAKIGDTKCVFCNSLCSRCQYYSDGSVCYTCTASAFLIQNYDQCLITFPGYKNLCQTNFQCVQRCPSTLYFQLLEAFVNYTQYSWSANNINPNITKTNLCYLCHYTCRKCYDAQNISCFTCTSNSYLTAFMNECFGLFPGDIHYCKANNNCYESKCPQQLYFELPQINTTNPKYPLTANSYWPNLRDSNICYLCHKYCLTCIDNTINCSSCSATFFKWQQPAYGNLCNYYCNQGTSAPNSTLGQYISPISIATRTCSVCATGCTYCSNSSSNCYMCQDNYFLLDDMNFCKTIYTCKLCQTPENGGIVTDGCQAADKVCRRDNCPQFFYFQLFTASNGGLNDTLVTNPKYKYFTFGSVLNTSENGYEWNTTRSSFTDQISSFPSTQIHYRRLTNLCSLCDNRCLKCTGPSNYNCSLCVNLYYKWTNATVCESFCPEGQFQLVMSAIYPDNQTKCGQCDAQCFECLGFKNNCTKCHNFSKLNYSFLFIQSLQNSTCLSVCQTSTNTSIIKGLYGSIATMICYLCPGNCSNCNINYVMENYDLLFPIICGLDNYCLKGVVCTDCLSGFIPIAGVCFNQTTCRQYSYNSNFSSTWNSSNCLCFEGYYPSSYLTCSRCDISCQTCIGPSSNNCISCNQGFILSSSACTQFSIYRQDTWITTGSSITSSSYILTNNNVSAYCGNYFTLFGYQTTYNENSFLLYSSPVLTTPNFYAISFKVSILFIDNWDNSASINLRLNLQTSNPFFVFPYDNNGAIGQQLCGTNALDYIFILSGKINLQPTGNNSYLILLSSNKSPIQNISGFYYMWGIKDAIFSVLKCHADCATCSGSSATECLSCSNSHKIIKNGSCVCDSNNNYFWSVGSNSSCMFGCPTCNSVAGNQSTNCYYKDYLTNRCVNPPLTNCSIPNIYGTPFELSNTYGVCVQNCSLGYFAIPALFKCTTNCSQFNLFYYSGVPINSSMGVCVSICPNNLIIDPSTNWCVTICPQNYYLQLENNICSNNCTTGFQNDSNRTCVLNCQQGFFSQTLNGHHKCISVCLNAFAENTTKKCVNICPNFSIADPTTHICVAVCPFGYFLQISLLNGNRTCVTQCQTGQWLNLQTNCCISNPKNCPNGTYGDNNFHICSNKCIQGQFGENLTQTCQKDCLTGFGNRYLRICVSECPSYMFYYTRNLTKLCVLSCNFSQTGQYADINFNRSCIYLPPYNYFILRSSITTVKITTQGNYSTTISQIQSNTYPDFLHNDAQWIWCGPDYIWPDNFTVTLESSFEVECKTSANLQISCDHSCAIYLNNALINNVGLFPASNIVLDLVCGINNLKIVATTGSAGSSAGVIYSILQNQTICRTNVSENNLLCDCQNRYPCPLPYVWAIFPTCKCICPNNSISCFTPTGNPILVSNTSSVIIKPLGNYSPTISSYYSNLYPNYLNNSAQWIWYSENKPPTPTITFQSIFWAMCIPATLQILGNNNFTAYLNDVVIASGKSFPLSYVSLNPTQGTNNLTVMVSSLDSTLYGINENPGLIFAIYQNQTIPECVSSGQFNIKQCKCRCKKNQICFSPFTWLDYPTCKCSCAGSQTDCPSNQIYNLKICRCVSKRVNRQIEEAQIYRSWL